MQAGKILHKMVYSYHLVHQVFVFSFLNEPLSKINKDKTED